MEYKTFDEWFESLTPEQQKEFVEDYEADHYVEEPVDENT